MLKTNAFKLKDVALVKMGQSPDSRYYNSEGVGPPFLQGCGQFGALFPNTAIHCSVPNKIAPEGSILFSVRAPVGEINIADRDYCIGRGLAAVIAEDVNPDLLYYLLTFIKPELQRIAQGSTFKAISSTDLAEFQLPNLGDEVGQAKIAEVLTAVDQAITQTEALIAKYQRIKTGLMQDLLTRGIDENGNLRDSATHEFKSSTLGRIPADWTAHNLVDVAFIIDPNPSHRYPPALEDGIPLVSTENFQGANGFDLTKSQYVSNLVYEDQNLRCDFQKTDIVFARKGRLGFARPYGEKKKVFSHTVVIIKPRNRKVIADYLLWCLRFRDFFEQIDKRMNSNSGVPTLGIEFLGRVPIRVPHPKEQQKICDLLNNIDQQIEKEIQSLEKTKKTKQGLMQDLLTGKVSVAPLLARSREN